MPRLKKRPLRRCIHCHKVGHNRSTCQEIGGRPAEVALSVVAPHATASPTPMPAPVKFFIHHVSSPAAPSAHTVNLKKNHDNVWNYLAAAAPEPEPFSHYLFHHRAGSNHRSAASTVAPPPTPLFSPFFAPTQPTVANNRPPAFPPPARTAFSAASRAAERIVNGIFSRRRWAVAIPALVALAFIPNYYLTQLKTSAEAIAADSAAGFGALSDSSIALRSASFTDAADATSRARENFSEALRILQNHRALGAFAASLPLIGDGVRGREQLLIAGQEIALGNSYLIEGISRAGSSSSTTLLNKLSLARPLLGEALPYYRRALSALDAVAPTALPAPYRAKLTGFKKLFAAAVNDLEQTQKLSAVLPEIFGAAGRRRYLLIFQNEAEARPTGGFMGSFALLEVKDGKIISLNVPPGGSYDLQGQLNEYQIPPLPLTLSNRRWEFQDANWFPDFPQSAQKILWFYRHARSVSADGVIAINSAVLPRLLSLLGPLDLPGRQLTISAENALLAIQQTVEAKTEKATGRPKQIIADLAPRILAALGEWRGEMALPLLGALESALAEKDIQAYFIDATAEAAAVSLGWSGAITATNPPQDYLMVVNTNIQGEKSDARVTQAIAHQSLVAADGSVIDTVTITRAHGGQVGEEFYGSANIDYLRLYVPAGSELLFASGFSWPDEKKFRAPEPWFKTDQLLLATEREISIDRRSGTRVTEEFGKTAFGNWVVIEPGETRQLKFTYRLPFRLFKAGESAASRYQLLAQRQSGAESSFESQLIFPAGWSPAWGDGTALTLAANGAAVSPLPLRRDQIWSVALKKN